MPWDMFCSYCGSTLVGDMIDGEQEMKDSQAEYEGSIIYCSHCNTYLDFISGEPIDLISHLYGLFNNKNAPYEVRIINGG